jgi:hypothetical protein
VKVRREAMRTAEARKDIFAMLLLRIVLSIRKGYRSVLNTLLAFAAEPPVESGTREPYLQRIGTEPD